MKVFSKIAETFSHFFQKRFILAAARTIIAIMLAYCVGALLFLPEPYWACLSAAIVARGYVGAALHIGLKRVTGALIGAVWAMVIVVASREHIVEGMALAIVVTPPALLTAWNTLYSPALVSALIVLAASTQAPWMVAVLRVAALGLGAIVAIAVTTWLWPQSAYAAAKVIAGKIQQALLRSLQTPYTRTAHLEEKLLPHLESMNKLVLVAGREKSDMGRTWELYTATAKALCSALVALRLAQEAKEKLPLTHTEGNPDNKVDILMRQDMLELKRLLRE